MLIGLAIVAVPERLAQAQQLSAQLNNAPIAVDQDRNGGHYHGLNHDRALILANTQHDGESAWTVILEDDSEPVPDFMQQLPAALNACPTSAASLYLGTQRMPRRHKPVELALKEDAHWVLSDTLLHGVCFAIRTDLLHPLLTTVENIHGMDADARYGHGLRRMGGYQVAHTVSSLVDHSDGPPVITKAANGNPRTRSARKALRVGGRQVWDSSYITM